MRTFTRTPTFTGADGSRRSDAVRAEGQEPFP